jgi:hypothetical protein
VRQQAVKIERLAYLDGATAHRKVHRGVKLFTHFHQEEMREQTGCAREIVLLAGVASNACRESSSNALISGRLWTETVIPHFG